MKGYLVLLALLGLANAAPQNWPYRDSLMPNHRYGYPSESYLKYLPQIEDDEDIGPYPARFRQEGIVVGSDGQSAHYVFRRPISENKAWSPNWKIGDYEIHFLFHSYRLHNSFPDLPFKGSLIRLGKFLFFEDIKCLMVPFNCRRPRSTNVSDRGYWGR